MSVVANQYIKLIVQHDIGFGSASRDSSGLASWGSGERESTSRNELFLGAFLCLIYLAQMTMFIVGSSTRKWMYKRAFVYGMEAVGGLCLFLISVVRNPFALLLIAFGCGMMAAQR